MEWGWRGGSLHFQASLPHSLLAQDVIDKWGAPPETLGAFLTNLVSRAI